MDDNLYSPPINEIERIIRTPKFIAIWSDFNESGDSETVAARKAFMLFVYSRFDQFASLNLKQRNAVTYATWRFSKPGTPQPEPVELGPSFIESARGYVDAFSEGVSEGFTGNVVPTLKLLAAVAVVGVGIYAISQSTTIIKNIKSLKP